MNDVVIIGAVRTAVGRIGGSLKGIEPADLAATVIKEALVRANIEGSQVDEVIIGQTRQTSSASNISRVAALKADIPEEVSAFTVHRQCGSALQSIVSGWQEIQTDVADVVIAGGTEVLSRSPYYMIEARYGTGAGNMTLIDGLTEGGPGAQPVERYGRLPMGLTAENVSLKYQISREDQDLFALASQEKAKKALSEGRFEKEIVSVAVKEKGKVRDFRIDEHPRETSLEQLASLKSAFKEGGTVTAGNSCGFNDGAGALVLASSQKAAELKAQPVARLVSWGVSGVSPNIMGIGPVPATQKALERAGLSLKDIDLIELNEAFAAQALAVIKELGVNPDIVNVNGGAIALGHPIGATGAIIMTKLIYALREGSLRYGLATLCIGGGQGMSIIVENLQM